MPVEDFLPPPEEFAHRAGAPAIYAEDSAVTMERETLEYFQHEAEKCGEHHLRLIRGARGAGGGGVAGRSSSRGRRRDTGTHHAQGGESGIDTRYSTPAHNL